MTPCEQALIEVMLLLVEPFQIGLKLSNTPVLLPVGLKGKITMYVILFPIRREKQDC
jgi:hypothetical protein